MSTVNKVLQANNMSAFGTGNGQLYIADSWNVIDVTEIAKSFDVYDVEHKGSKPTKYGIRLFYKEIVDGHSIYPETWEESAVLDSNNRIDLTKISTLGTPVNEYTRGSIVTKTDLICRDDIVDIASYVFGLPSNEELNASNLRMDEFLIGSPITEWNTSNKYCLTVDRTIYQYNGFNYLLHSSKYNSNKQYLGALKGLSINRDTSEISYTLDISASAFNIPTDETAQPSLNNYLAPELFKPFIVSTKPEYSNDEPVMLFYCVLGIKEEGYVPPAPPVPPEPVKPDVYAEVSIRNYEHQDLSFSATSDDAFGVDVPGGSKMWLVAANRSYPETEFNNGNIELVIYTNAFGEYEGKQLTAFIFYLDNNGEQHTESITLTDEAIATLNISLSDINVYDPVAVPHTKWFMVNISSEIGPVYQFTINFDDAQV